MKSPQGLPLLLRNALLGAAVAALAPSAGRADSIRHPTAIFAGLDKITGRIIDFDVAIDETVQFGTLQVTPRVCNTRPQTETPLTTTFVEVDELQPKSDQKKDSNGAGRSAPKFETKRIFSGWMFASSPGLHGVEHPVYDVWLVGCKGGKEVAAQPPPPEAQQPAPDASQPDGRKGRTRRVVPKTPVNPEAQAIGPADEPVFNSNAAPAADPAAAQPKPGRQRRQRSAPQQAAPPPPPQAQDPFGLF